MIRLPKAYNERTENPIHNEMTPPIKQMNSIGYCCGKCVYIVSGSILNPICKDEMKLILSFDLKVVFLMYSSIILSLADSLILFSVTNFIL